MSRRPVRYAEKIDRKKRRTRVLLNIAILIVFCALLRSFVAQTWRVADDAMLPSLRYGDVVLVVPYVVRLKGVPSGLAGSPAPGNVVLVDDGASALLSPLQRVSDTVLRFVTFQRLSILRAQYGESFSQSFFMRVRSADNADIASGAGSDSAPYLLASDRRATGTRSAPVLRVSASRIEGRAIFRIWPLSAIGPVR